MLDHGGAISKASLKYNIPVSEWLDLSTGINLNGYPVNNIPPKAWLKLPDNDNELNQAAKFYYDTEFLLSCNGSQSIIQLLPRLRNLSKVGIISPSYNEHEYAWRKQKHQIEYIDPDNIIQSACDNDILVICNPNNPSGKFYQVEELIKCRDILASKNGWLIIDEAFIDTNKDHSLSSLTDKSGLIVLRSVGKFFGLAGARVGFVIAEPKLLTLIQNELGPWCVTGPSQYIVTKALLDTKWQNENILGLKQRSLRLKKILRSSQLNISGSTNFFHWLVSDKAYLIQAILAQQAIWVRLFDNPPSVRIGIPALESEWERLQAALKKINQL